MIRNASTPAEVFLLDVATTITAVVSTVQMSRARRLHVELRHHALDEDTDWGTLLKDGAFLPAASRSTRMLS